MKPPVVVIWAALAVMALLFASPVQALVPGVALSAAPTVPVATSTISAEKDESSDGKIAERIGGIFSELPGLANVRVSVSQGVVSLTGTVAKNEDRARAEAIAGRVSGVVTIENEIVRDTSVGGATAGVKQVTRQFADFAAMLPLIGAAMLVWLVIAALGYLIAGFGGIWKRLAPNSFLAELLASAVRFTFVVGGLVVALNMLGAGALMGAVLGGAGVVGIALGFAMRDTIENYVASLMLSLRQPFRPNDWVVIDSHEGHVIRLTSRATILMTLDGNHLRIPNSAVFKAVILNYTRNPRRRFQFDLGIDADDDPTAARRVGRDALGNLDFVLADPAPESRIIEVGDSNVVLRFLGWIDQREADWHKARSNAIAAVKAALETAGFAIPEPIYRLRFDARTTPLPFENVAGESQAAVARPKEAARPKPAAAEDVSPKDEVAGMVENERQTSGQGQERDLLDPSRPVE
ncbi:mechanosensitive ion channel [Altererythrobacter salegens]|uniref:Small-conductance mechanosensitive channel n=1 Tax=Croceibacterium salegens TaxID=1737568 RepID=A0A6I4T340_9SPHN|nr:mechanosensitive ion channel domain-containing protein [Croceibacterium salegens]MXO61122.1 mechanosensitive ion channel [Croceibacterium salegens]